MTYEDLFKNDSKGKTRIWRISVSGNSFTTFAGIDGGNLVSKTTICHPKNVGKNNETTASEQAHIEAKAKWTKKQERELYTTKDKLGQEPIYKPCMLTLDATKVPHRIKWSTNEYGVQAKLNGVRCTTKFENGIVKLFSRKGKEYIVPHIQQQLLDYYLIHENPKLSFDGELYIHNRELGDVTHAVAHGHMDLQFWIFDLANKGLSFKNRHSVLTSCSLDNFSHLTHVSYKPVNNMDEVKRAHDGFVRKGFEGVIIRDLDSDYEFGKRTPALFKYKEFQDDEFIIIGVEPDKDGTGAVLVYETDDGIEFKARSIGSDSVREHQLANPNNYIGKKGTVRFSNLLSSGAPEFPRGIHIRDYE